MSKEVKCLSPYEISLINAVLSDGKRVELIPTPKGVEIKSIQRVSIK